MSSNWLSAGTSDLLGITAANQTAQTNRVLYAKYAIAQASTALSDGNEEKAITSFKSALALDPDNTTACNYLGKIYLSQGKTEESIKAYKQLVRIQSNLSTKDTSTTAPTQEAATISLGNAYLQAKQYNNAEVQFKAAAKLAPRDALPAYTLGQLYLTQDRLVEARTQLEQAKALSPKDGNVYFALGSVYNAQKNYLDAATALQKSIQLKPDFPEANYQLGVAYNGLNYTEGVQAQQKILDETDSTRAAELTAITKPKMVGINSDSSMNTFNAGLGSNTPLWVLDTSLITPDSSKEFTTVIQFSKEMDYDSITNEANWSISRGNNAKSGYYNSTIPISAKDAKITPIPVSVNYDSTTGNAFIKFRLTQNSSGNAVVDTKHLVFTFYGKDASGQTMDLTSNSVDGYAESPFGSIDTLA